MHVLGIDIGGSGIKGAVIDAGTGEMITERYRLETPAGAKPVDVALVVGQVARHFNWKGPIGCTFPAIIRNGVAHSAANVDKSWIGTDVKALFEEHTGNPVTVINDADAAGIAEMVFGAGRDQQGVIIMLTLGTGIGTALFVDGHLLPNSELGHIEMNGGDAERQAAESARERADLTWKKWGKRLNQYFQKLEFLLSPDLFIVGGGVSKKSEKFFKHIKTRAPLVVAQMRNEAGIIGGAMAAHAIFQNGDEGEFDAQMILNSSTDEA
ncbi:MAG: ROK family protein [Caldilineaceae bacterium]|nr:ROK family protein [Caldilineaceae bacterium]